MNSASICLQFGVDQKVAHFYRGPVVVVWAMAQMAHEPHRQESPVVTGVCATGGPLVAQMAHALKNGYMFPKHTLFYTISPNGISLEQHKETAARR